MDKLNYPIPTTGFVKLFFEDIEWALGLGLYSDGIIQGIEAQLSELGDNFIVTGCGAGGLGVQEGWIMLDGELLKVDEHANTSTHFEKVQSDHADGARSPQVGPTVYVFQKNRATVTASSGNLAYSGAKNLQSVLKGKTSGRGQYITSGGTYQMDDETSVVIINSVSSATIKMPAPGNAHDGKMFRILNISPSGHTVQTSSGGVQSPTTITPLYYLIYEYYSSLWRCTYNAAIP